MELIADAIKTISGGNSFLMIGIIIWLSAVASALVDNIPFAATMVPVIKSLGAGGPAGFCRFLPGDSQWERISAVVLHRLALRQMW